MNSVTQTAITDNKAFIQEYFNALSGQDKTEELCDQFMSDQSLKEHIHMFESGFPRYEIIADEMTAEDDRVVVKSRCRATHTKEWKGMLASHKTVEIQFVASYTVFENKIIDHWILIDQMSMMEQLQA